MSVDAPPAIVIALLRPVVKVPAIALQSARPVYVPSSLNLIA